MKKNRLIYLLFSIAVSILCMFFSFFDPDNYILYTIIIICIMMPNLTLKKYERNELLNIMYRYAYNCDPYEYLYDLQEFHSKTIQTKKIREFNRITYALIYLDCGNSENALEILYSLIDSEKKMSDYTLFWYYRAWIIYYFDKREPEQIKVLLDQIKEIIERAPTKIKNNYYSVYNLLLAKYYVSAGIYLDNAKEVYETSMKNNNSILINISCLYNIGLINMLKKDFLKAKDNFETVSNSNKKLGIVEKANEYLEKINNLLRK